MLGSPLARAAVAAAVLLLLIVPLRSLTAPRKQATPPAGRPVAESAAHLEIVSTKAPFHFAVVHLGKTIWQGDSAETTARTDARLPIPAQGVDLVLQVGWRDPGVAAAKLILTAGDGEPIVRTLWGDGEAVDALKFP